MRFDTKSARKWPENTWRGPKSTTSRMLKIPPTHKDKTSLTRGSFCKKSDHSDPTRIDSRWHHRPPFTCDSTRTGTIVPTCCMNLDQSAPETVQKTFCHGVINKEHDKNKLHAWGLRHYCIFIYTWSHRMFAECFTLSIWTTGQHLSLWKISNLKHSGNWNLKNATTIHQQQPVARAKSRLAGKDGFARTLWKALRTCFGEMSFKAESLVMRWKQMKTGHGLCGSPPYWFWKSCLNMC